MTSSASFDFAWKKRPALDTPSRRERNKREKRKRIVRAARSLFTRKGFESTTTREIADIGAGTLFLYAGTKEDLLVSIARAEIERVTQDTFDAVPRRAALLGQILHLFGALIACHERDPAFARVFVKELPFVEDRRHGIAEMTASLLGGISRLIEAAQARRDLLASVPPIGLAHDSFALYFAQLQRWFGGDPITAAKRDEGLRASLELPLAALTRGSPQLGVYDRSNAPAPSIAGARAKRRLRGVR